MPDPILAERGRRVAAARINSVQRDLVVRAKAGDHDAFSTLAAASIGRLLAAARLILRDEDRAQDAVQDALVRAWLDIRGLRDPDRFDAWLHRLLVRGCYRAAKSDRGRRLVEVQLLPIDGPSAPDAQVALVTRDQLDRAFRRLPTEQRAVLVLHHYLDMSDGEAADVLDIPLGTFKSRLNRANQALRAAVEADDRQAEIARESIA
ncbi:MAG TPA: RNA polymerase sigma factor [Candidatus Limnocylindrales bacterium]